MNVSIPLQTPVITNGDVVAAITLAYKALKKDVVVTAEQCLCRSCRQTQTTDHWLVTVFVRSQVAGFIHKIILLVNVMGMPTYGDDTNLVYPTVGMIMEALAFLYDNHMVRRDLQHHPLTISYVWDIYDDWDHFVQSLESPNSKIYMKS